MNTPEKKKVMYLPGVWGMVCVVFSLCFAIVFPPEGTVKAHNSAVVGCDYTQQLNHLGAGECKEPSVIRCLSVNLYGNPKPSEYLAKLWLTCCPFLEVFPWFFFRYSPFSNVPCFPGILPWDPLHKINSYLKISPWLLPLRLALDFFRQLSSSCSTHPPEFHLSSFIFSMPPVRPPATTCKTNSGISHFLFTLAWTHLPDHTQQLDNLFINCKQIYH